MRILYGSNPYTIASDYRKQGYKVKYIHIAVIYASFKFEFDFENSILDSIKKLNLESLTTHNRGLMVENNFTKFINTYYKRSTERLQFIDDCAQMRSVE